VNLSYHSRKHFAEEFRTTAKRVSAELSRPFCALLAIISVHLCQTLHRQGTLEWSRSVVEKLWCQSSPLR
jgi:hypothetical protein